MQQAGAPLLIIGKGGGERFLQHLREGAEATGGAASAAGAVVRCVTSCDAFREATSPLGSDQIRVGVSPSATHGEVISTCEFTTAQRSRSMTLALCCPSAAARTWRWSRRRNSVSAPSRPWPTP